MAIALRLELSGQDHPVGIQVEQAYEELVTLCSRLVRAGRRAGTIPPGLPVRAVALAFIGALEGSVMALAGLAPHDEVLAVRAVAGVLGQDPLAVGACQLTRPIRRRDQEDDTP